MDPIVALYAAVQSLVEHDLAEAEATHSIEYEDRRETLTVVVRRTALTITVEPADE